MKFKNKNGDIVECCKYEAALLRGRGEILNPVEEKKEKPVPSKPKAKKSDSVK